VRRLVISKRWTGLGDCLVSLLAAWRFAHATHRTLVADWRGSGYASDPRTNVFRLVFEPARTLADVPFLGDDTVNHLALAGPFHPASWDGATVLRPSIRPTLEDRAEREGALALIESGVDVAAPVVVFDGCLNDAVPSPDDCRRVLGDLRPQARIAAEVAAFEARHLAGRPVVAMHVRHGDGGALRGHARFWVSPLSALVRVVGATLRAAHAVRAATGAGPVIFLCTDSAPVERALRRALPGVVTRPKAFPRLAVRDQPTTSLEDSAVDMLLLARSDVLVRFPPGSFFSFWGAVMKGVPCIAIDRAGPGTATDLRPRVC
jgi:hypothetical protein